MAMIMDFINYKYRGDNLRNNKNLIEILLF
jgi:hypothetical protein